MLFWRWQRLKKVISWSEFLSQYLLFRLDFRLEFQSDFLKAISLLLQTGKVSAEQTANIYIGNWNTVKNCSLDSTKGQLISKCLFEVFVWAKIPTKNLIISALKGPGQKLSKFLLVFWSKRWFHKDILKLTDL